LDRAFFASFAFNWTTLWFSELVARDRISTPSHAGGSAELEASVVASVIATWTVCADQALLVDLGQQGDAGWASGILPCSGIGAIDLYTSSRVDAPGVSSGAVALDQLVVTFLSALWCERAWLGVIGGGLGLTVATTWKSGVSVGTIAFECAIKTLRLSEFLTSHWISAPDHASRGADLHLFEVAVSIALWTVSADQDLVQSFRQQGDASRARWFSIGRRLVGAFDFDTSAWIYAPAVAG
jgi:hypothetical protein